MFRARFTHFLRAVCSQTATPGPTVRIPRGPADWNGNYSDAVVDRVVAELSTPNRTGFLRALAPR